VRAAHAFGPAAPQPPSLLARMLGGDAEASAEDCLSVNVWTPGPDAARRPVLVWVHGGGFTTGSGSLSFYDGAALSARGDVVLVTLNYRLGALGFLHLPELLREEGGAPANFGLLDQIQALEWVRDNAPAFGGDPDRVTLFGQSAGAMCVSTLMGVERARGLFRRAVLQSGAAHNVNAAATAARVAEVFAGEAGVRPGDVAALRALPVGRLLEAQAGTALRLAQELPQPPFQPCLDATLLPRPPLEAVAAGLCAGVDVLVGTNLDEWRFYGLSDPRWRDLDEARLLRRFQRGLPGSDAQGRSRAERVIATYREARAQAGASTDPKDLWFAIQTDRWFRAPAMRLAAGQAEHGRCFAYLFTWPSPALEGVLGSCHALDIPFVFGGVDDPRLAGFVGPAAAGLSARMQDAWLAFARSGEPGHAGLPAWPAYDARRRATMLLGEACELVHAPGERERAFWDAIA
jgi:para-nitrobenzyl esterase